MTITKNLIQLVTASALLGGLSWAEGFAQVKLPELEKKAKQTLEEAIPEPPDLGPGLRVGWGSNPDQFVFGFQTTLGKRLGPIFITPSADFGFGSGATTIALNIDLRLRLRVEGTKFRLFGGVGPTFAYMDFENQEAKWETGASVVAGARFVIKRKRAINFEARLGYSGVPDLRLLLIFFPKEVRF